MKKTTLDRIDFSRIHKDLYTATTKIKEVDADEAVFLSLDGKGEPGGPEFQTAIQQMYSLVYTAKFMLKNAGKLDFGIGRLECLWYGNDFERTPRSEWRWQLLIRIPEEVSEKDLRDARAEVLKKRSLRTSAVKRWTWTEGRCVQVMHVGPYDEVGKAYRALDEYARAKGMAVACPAHEIYISDPHRVAPAKLKTIIRLAIG